MLLSEEFMTGRVATRESAERDRETELLRVIRAEHEARHDDDRTLGWVRRHRAAVAARAASRRGVAAAQENAPSAVTRVGDGAGSATSLSGERRELEPAGR